MELKALFFNRAGRLRSGWRLLIFVLLYAILFIALGYSLRIALLAATIFHLHPGMVVQDFANRLLLLLPALIAGWLCCWRLEGLPWRALGLWMHRFWFSDFIAGSLIGAGSLIVAATIAFGAGRLRFTFTGRAQPGRVVHAACATIVVFVIAALAEEAIFRGYPLQTLTRAGLIWFGVLLTSFPFAAVHLDNPNVVAGFTFANTALAGVWLAAAYLRTRSLWFPLGVHWAWNWAQGSVFGIPVSGIKITDYPVFRAMDHGPAWLTGGSYGLEGGAACTIALVLSTIYIWRTSLVKATSEMEVMTSGENPIRRAEN